MASGIDIDKHPAHIVEGLIDAQLDSYLIDYYKLLVQTFIKAGDADNANSSLEKLRKLILMDYSSTIDKKTAQMQLLADMDNWKVEVDIKSLRLPQNRLVRRKPKKKKKED